MLGPVLALAAGLALWKVCATPSDDHRDASTRAPVGADDPDVDRVDAELAATRDALAPSGATDRARERAAASRPPPDASAARAARAADGEPAALHGRVLWPDGAGAAGANLALEQVSGYAREADDELRCATDGQGRFALGADSSDLVSAVSAGDVRVRAWIEDAAGAMHAAVLDAPATAHLDAAEGVTLILSPVAAVRGRVVAADGGAVGPFQARLAPHGGVGRMFEAQALAAARFNRAGGDFAVPVAEAGAMRLEVAAAGLVQREPLVLDLPGDAAREHLVVLERVARISGLVVTPDGAPCPDAIVHLHDLSEFAVPAPYSPRESRRTDAAGRFALEAVVPGVAKLSAESAGWAPSELVSLDVAPGVDLRDVRIELRRGGTIAGEMLDARGAGIPNAPVVAVHAESMRLETAQTDADGAFAFERLGPGWYQVQGTPSSDPEPDPAKDAASALMEHVEVSLGETAHVTLGGVHPDAVLVRGRVTVAGEGVYAEVVFLPDAGGGQGRGLSGMAQTSTDDGRYQVRVERPGDYVVLISSARSTPFHEVIRIPAGPELLLDVALPEGAIAGTVRDADGAPAGDVLVKLQRSDGVVNGMPFGLFDQGTATDSEGRYTLKGLAPGLYDVFAGGGSPFPAFDPTPAGELPLARAAGVRVARGERVAGIDLALVRGGRLAGRVVDSGGRPVPGATVWFRDASGGIVERMSPVTTDGGGRFHARLLPPGDYTALARTADRVAPESAPVRVAAGATASVELVAAPGARLRAVCRPADSAPPLAGTVIALADAAGRALEGLSGADALQALCGGGISSTAPVLGLLPPGTYRVRASSTDGRRAEADVTLAPAQGEGVLELVLR
jgi:hypothetical protein